MITESAESRVVHRQSEQDRNGNGSGGPVRVGVIVDLHRMKEAGGHVKCWEHFARAAAEIPDLVDLTVHFLGEREEVKELAPNVRYVTVRPLLGTSGVLGGARVPAHTDIAPFNRRVVPYLRRYDVIHTTGAYFALSKTARRFARFHSVPHVNSIHTDVPRYAGLFTGDILRKMTRRIQWIRPLIAKLGLAELAPRVLQSMLRRFHAACDWVLVSRAEDAEAVERKLPGRVSLLRRGVDKDDFDPSRRDRKKLQELYGVPADKFLILFVGRIDAAKNVRTVAEAAKLVLDEGRPIHVLLVGQGNQEKEVRRLLGQAATMPGVLPQDDLGWIYASADMFVFPSETEVCPNVVIEARSAGLPVVLARGPGSSELLREEGVDGVSVPGQDPAQWARTIMDLMDQPEKLRRMGREARSITVNDWPSWEDVLKEDLLPVWQAVPRTAVNGAKTPLNGDRSREPAPPAAGTRASGLH